MSSLKERVLVESRLPEIHADVRNLLDGEVKKKGLLIKVGYKVVKTFRRGFLKKVIADLLPEFCDALEPIHQRHLEEPKGTFGALMLKNREEVTEALLSVTDGKAQRSTNRIVKKQYSKLRPSAVRNVSDAVPGLADVLDKYYQADDAPAST